MAVNFKKPGCVSTSNKKKFGLCDDQPPLPKGPAYIDEIDGAKWIAIVINDPPINIHFTAIDNCVDIIRPDGKMDKRCDGMLSFNETVIFVELKEINMHGAEWIRTAEKQLRTTISYFEEEEDSITFKVKKAYIANSERPTFRNSQQTRMERFEDETGYLLRIENRIYL